MPRDGDMGRMTSRSAGGEYIGDGILLSAEGGKVIIEKCRIESDALGGAGVIVNPDDAVTMRIEGVTIRYDGDG